MTVRLGDRAVEVGGPELGTLRDGSALLGDPEGLRAQLAEDGYLLLPGLQDPNRVRRARRHVLAYLETSGRLDLAGAELGRAAPAARGEFLGPERALSRAPELLDLVEAPEIMEFFRVLFADEVLTFDFKWLRAIAPGEATGAHYDAVYMGRGTDRLLTAWTPLGDVPYELGPLAILAGSHRFERLKQTYGRVDVDRDRTRGWLSVDPLSVAEVFGGQWQTAEFRAGDTLIFGIHTLHCSLANTSPYFRLSCDTRFQRAVEPVDERWVGAEPRGHAGWREEQTISDLRKRWHL